MPEVRGLRPAFRSIVFLDRDNWDRTPQRVKKSIGSSIGQSLQLEIEHIILEIEAR